MSEGAVLPEHRLGKREWRAAISPTGANIGCGETAVPGTGCRFSWTFSTARKRSVLAERNVRYFLALTQLNESEGYHEAICRARRVSKGDLSLRCR